MKKTAWSIRLGLTRSDKAGLMSGTGDFIGHGFIDYKHFMLSRPWGLQGYEAATFWTRKDARKALRELKCRSRWDWPWAKVVKVVVLVKEIY